VALGETTCDPFNATGVPFKSALTQLTVFHVSVELHQMQWEVGFALMPAAASAARAGAQITTPIPINQQAGSKVGTVCIATDGECIDSKLLDPVSENSIVSSY